MRRKELINVVKSRDRAPLEFETHIAEHEGDVMSIAKKKVITVPQSATIKESAEIMVKNRFRILPVTDPGTRKILGIITSMDILNFLGGGDKYQILEKKHDGNFLSAVNKPVKEIMTRKVEFLNNKSSIGAALSKLIEKRVGALPVIDSNEKIVGIVSEKDIAMLISEVLTDEVVEKYMTSPVVSTTPGTRIEGATKIMVRNKLRRIPIIGEERKTPHPENDKLVGIVTSSDILEFLGKNTAFEKIITNNDDEILNSAIFDKMEKNVITASIYARLSNVVAIMKKEGIGGLPIVRGNELVGIITEHDILKAISG